jgi:hypothetical protein
VFLFLMVELFNFFLLFAHSFECDLTNHKYIDP